MYKLVYWRYGSRKIEEFETFKDAKEESKCITDYGEGFVEGILDENNIILIDEKDNLLVKFDNSRVGQEYIFNLPN
jgi:hypothetical protein